MSLKLRKQINFCIPEGPSFSRAENVSFYIDETKIALKAPKHHSGYSSRKSREPEGRYISSNMTFRSFYDEDFFLDDSWREFSILSRSWGFKGPFLSGYLGELHMHLAIISPAELNKHLSFFHPRVFEQAVGDYLAVCYSKHEFNGRSEWFAPVNWEAVNDLPCNAVKLDVKPNSDALNIKSISKYLFVPIADQFIMFFRYNIEQRVKGLLEERDKIVSRESMENLANDIINSLQVTLSPEAQAQQKRALEGLEDTSLRKEFPPMKWTTPEQDAEWEEYARLSGIQQD